MTARSLIAITDLDALLAEASKQTAHVAHPNRVKAEVSRARRSLGWMPSGRAPQRIVVTS